MMKNLAMSLYNLIREYISETTWECFKDSWA